MPAASFESSVSQLSHEVFERPIRCRFVSALWGVYMFDFSLSLLFNLGTGVVVIASVVYFSPEALLTQKL